MNDLDAEDRALLDLAREGHEPSAADHQRVRRLLAASLGGAVGLATTTAVGTSVAAATGAASVATKMVVVAVIAAAAGAGGAAAISRARPRDRRFDSDGCGAGAAGAAAREPRPLPPAPWSPRPQRLRRRRATSRRSWKSHRRGPRGRSCVRGRRSERPLPFRDRPQWRSRRRRSKARRTPRRWRLPCRRRLRRRRACCATAWPRCTQAIRPAPSRCSTSTHAAMRAASWPRSAAPSVSSPFTISRPDCRGESGRGGVPATTTRARRFAHAFARRARPRRICDGFGRADTLRLRTPARSKRMRCSRTPLQIRAAVTTGFALGAALGCSPRSIEIGHMRDAGGSQGSAGVGGGNGVGGAGVGGAGIGGGSGGSGPGVSCCGPAASRARPVRRCRAGRSTAATTATCSPTRGTRRP